jgi:flagellar biogenesis protein FliO
VKQVTGTTEKQKLIQVIYSQEVQNRKEERTMLPLVLVIILIIIFLIWMLMWGITGKEKNINTE